MHTPWINEYQLYQSIRRNQAFWSRQLEDYPLLWITVPGAKKGKDLPEPNHEQEMWTDIDYFIAYSENTLSRTHFAGDALPVCHPWLGPDQFAAWLGAEITLKPKEFTSWVKPFVNDWSDYPVLKIAPNNPWWKLYIETVRASAQAGQDKWITAYPDLHSGIDGLCAIRGPENLMLDMVAEPDTIHRHMAEMTALWQWIVDQVTAIIAPYGQGSSNWTGGWSRDRFLCIGQNDFSCLISPPMFREFCREDNLQCCQYVDQAIYHLDGPDALRHLPLILDLKKLNCIQWIQGAGHPLPSRWLDLLQQIQAAGKTVQLCYAGSHGGDADFFEEIEILCTHLDPCRLFFNIQTDSAEKADALVRHARKICRSVAKKPCSKT